MIEAVNDFVISTGQSLGSTLLLGNAAIDDSLSGRHFEVVVKMLKMIDVNLDLRINGGFDVPIVVLEKLPEGSGWRQDLQEGAGLLPWRRCSL